MPATSKSNRKPRVSRAAEAWARIDTGASVSLCYQTHPELQHLVYLCCGSTGEVLAETYHEDIEAAREQFRSERRRLRRVGYSPCRSFA